jgi:hypothetical protein
VRPILALLGGIATSMTGLGVALDTTWELAGVALIVAGVAIAAQGTSAAPVGATGGASRVNGGSVTLGRSSIVGWPRGLGPRLARGGGRRRTD